MPLIGGFAGQSQRPVIKGRVVFRRLGVSGDLQFLVDTGADHTMIASTDASELGIDPARLSAGPVLAGIGGAVETHSEFAAVVFEGDAGDVYIYRMNIIIASSRVVPRGLPSVLGRDILNRWHMTYRPTERRLEFDVVTADGSLDLDA